MSSANIYSRADPTEARPAKVLTVDKGRRIAANIARLPDLFRRAGRAEQQS